MDTPELTPKQKCFVNEYIIDLNAKAAAERAGYSKRMSKAIGWELLQKPQIAAAIAEEISAREKRTRVSAAQRHEPAGDRRSPDAASRRKLGARGREVSI